MVVDRSDGLSCALMRTDIDWMAHHVFPWGQTQIGWTIMSSHGDRHRSDGPFCLLMVTDTDIHSLPNTLLKPTLLASANHKSMLSTHGFGDYILVYVCNLRHPVSRNQFREGQVPDSEHAQNISEMENNNTKVSWKLSSWHSTEGGPSVQENYSLTNDITDDDYNLWPMAQAYH